MSENRMSEIREQTIFAFNAAVIDNFIMSNFPEKIIIDKADYVLGYMPDFKATEFSDDEYEYAVNILISQLF